MALDFIQELYKKVWSVILYAVMRILILVGHFVSTYHLTDCMRCELENVIQLVIIC